MASRRKPVRADRVELVYEGEVLRLNNMKPTPERMAKGDVRVVHRHDDQGRVVTLQRAVTVILTEQLELAGEVGENVPRLLTAAEWFIEQLDAAKLTGRLVHSQLVQRQRADVVADATRRIARQNLLRCYDVLGVDAFSVMFDVLGHEIAPQGPMRRALFRAGLHALAQALKTP